MALYAVSIFLGAFLLFLVQPMLGKYVLPMFGGGPAIWTTCMLFYQTLLLGGYAYSHWITSRLSLRRQGIVHLFVLAGSLLLLPITPEIAEHAGAQAPVRRILILLLVSAGAPFFVVSTTAPLLQRWFSQEHPQSKPYRLYALSNTGSMLGLLAYPFLLEPLVGLRSQMILWSWGLALFVATTGWCTVRLIRHAGNSISTDSVVPVAAGDEASTPMLDRVAWLALSACGSLLLLATTSRMTEDITPVPFLWVLPLGIYVLSFVITFERDRWYDRRIWPPLFVVAVAVVLTMMFQGEYVTILVQVPVYVATLFLGCMVCHGELVRLKPDPRHLTSFYLWVSAGGALGGVLAALVAPRVLQGYWEYQIAVIATLVLLAANLIYDPTLAARGLRRRWLPAATLVAATTFAAIMGIQIRQDRVGLIASLRNFYGVLEVYDYDAGSHYWTRMLYHGAMVQGGQMLHEDYRGLPTTYYGVNSGVAVAIEYLRRPDNSLDALLKGGDRGLRIGVVGLGVGTTAALADAGDTVRFYEIDPNVVELSSEYFRYLDDSPAAQEIVLGDARVSMQRELQAGDPQRFDLLALDAFNSDAVPAHLLTREAFELYAEHLAPNGILAVHISSNHLNLAPVVRAMADVFGWEAVRIVNKRDWSELVEWSDWVLLTADGGFAADSRVVSRSSPWRGSKKLLWTDDHSSLLPLVDRTWD